VNKLVLWLVLIAVTLVVGALAAYWWLDLRWRPKTVTKTPGRDRRRSWNRPAGSRPGLDRTQALHGRLPVLSRTACAFKADVLPKLVHEAGVDTRVIEIARRDRNGLEPSPPRPSGRPSPSPRRCSRHVALGVRAPRDRQPHQVHRRRHLGAVGRRPNITVPISQPRMPPSVQRDRQRLPRVGSGGMCGSSARASR
jgi:hypothetical protein